MKWPFRTKGAMQSWRWMVRYLPTKYFEMQDKLLLELELTLQMESHPWSKSLIEHILKFGRKMGKRKKNEMAEIITGQPKIFNKGKKGKRGHRRDKK